MTGRFEWMEYEEAPVVSDTDGAPDAARSVLDAVRAYAEGRYDTALQSWSAALRQDKTRHEGWAGQVHCLVRLDEVQEAQTWAAKACQLFPGAAVLHSARARALAAGGLVAQALGASDQALELAERSRLQDAWLWLDRAACLLADDRHTTAAWCLDKVRELRPGDPDWEQEIALEWLSAGVPAAALVSLNRVVEARPQRSWAWFLQARALRLLGQRSSAAVALGTAGRLDAALPGLGDEQRLLLPRRWLPSWGGGLPGWPLTTESQWLQGEWRPPARQGWPQWLILLLLSTSGLRFPGMGLLLQWLNQRRMNDGETQGYRNNDCTQRTDRSARQGDAGQTVSQGQGHAGRPGG